MGIEVNGLNINWGQTQKNKESIVTSLTKGIEGLFKKNKVTYLKGSGQFVDATTMYKWNKLEKYQAVMEIHKRLKPARLLSQLVANQMLSPAYPLTKRLLLAQLELSPYLKFLRKWLLLEVELLGWSSDQFIKDLELRLL